MLPLRFDDHTSPRRELLIAAGFIAAAILLRLPALLYSVTNFDESLYLLIGDELVRGTLPFTGLCDRKPFGLFALFALFAAMPFDAIVASRVGASLSVGIAAYLLHRVARLLFDDHERVIGATAGIAYILFSLADGGIASNSEVFLNSFALWASIWRCSRCAGPSGRACRCSWRPGSYSASASR